MREHMYVCNWVWFVHACVCVHMCVHVCVYMCLRVCACTCVCACVRSFVCMCVHVCVHVCQGVHVCVVHWQRKEIWIVRLIHNAVIRLWALLTSTKRQQNKHPTTDVNHHKPFSSWLLSKVVQMVQRWHIPAQKPQQTKDVQPAPSVPVDFSAQETRFSLK